ncbi:MAG: YtxH domain-containing protein [Cytophagaceae bacterium]|nr:MAG: YtxH domain-containing protein [Cytophagaceae bacterium]
MSRTGRDLTFLLTGIAAGSLVGLLYAPDKGKITRDRLSFRLSKYREQINQLLDELSNSTDLPENSSKNEGQRVVNDAREKAERLLEDVDKLMAQIKQQNA